MPSELSAHGLDLVGPEAEDLEIREAPVGLAQMGREGDALAIRGDALVVVACRLQGVARDHPDLRMIRVLAQQLALDPDRPLVFARAYEHGGVNVVEARLGRID